MEELHILLTPNKEHKNVFPNVPAIGFRNGKSLRHFLTRATLPKLNEGRRCESCGKKTCLVCDSISTATTFTTEACQETFKIQSGPLTYDSKKVLYQLKCKVCGEVLYVGKGKSNFDIGLITIKVNTEHLVRIIRKFLKNYFTLTVVSMAIAALEIGIL